MLKWRYEAKADNHKIYERWIYDNIWLEKSKDIPNGWDLYIDGAYEISFISPKLNLAKNAALEHSSKTNTKID